MEEKDNKKLQKKVQKKDKKKVVGKTKPIKVLKTSTSKGGEGSSDESNTSEHVDEIQTHQLVSVEELLQNKEPDENNGKYCTHFLYHLYFLL